MQASAILDSSMMDFFAFLISTAFHIEQILCIIFRALERSLNPSMNFTVVIFIGTAGQANQYLLGSSYPLASRHLSPIRLLF